MKRFYHKILFQLAVTITILIIIIETVLLVGSYFSKKKEYADIAANVVQRQQSAVDFKNDPLGAEFVSQKLSNFVFNVTILTLIIIFVTAGGTVIVFYYIALRHILLIRDINQLTTAENVLFIPEKNIPVNEVGDIMQFQNKMLKSFVDAKELLVQSAKMSALGEMAGGIAHEINTPLSVISLRAEKIEAFMLKNEINSEKLATDVEIIKKTAHRIAKIVKGLSYFARDGRRDTPASAKVYHIIEETLSFCMERFASRAIQVKFDKNNLYESLEIECRSIEILQVLLNLLNNASDALESLNEKWIKIDVADVGAFVEISVTDSGNGIPREVQEKMMQPFFTTKGVGRGTGLGLSISKGIVEEHQGQFYIDNNSLNTKFVIRLPKTQVLEKT